MPSSHTMENHWAIKRDKLLTRAPTWTSLEHMLLSERRQSWKTTHCLVPCTWKEQTKPTQGDRRDERLPGAGGAEG